MQTAEPAFPKKIFNVSLHRSGTQSFNNLCERLGLRAQHWPGFEFDKLCSSALESLNGQLVWDLYKTRVLSNDTFCDLPVPFVYEQAVRDYPDAYFLIVLRTPSSWIKSIRRHTRNRDLDVMEKFQYWSICEVRKDHISKYSDEELEQAYIKFFAKATNTIVGHSAKYQVFNLESPKLGSEIAEFLGFAGRDIQFENVDINRKFYGDTTSQSDL